MKPGWQTTEFWQTLAAFCVGLGLICYGVVQDKSEALLVGAAVAGLPASGYSISRGIAKAQAEATKEGKRP